MNYLKNFISLPKRPYRLAVRTSLFQGGDTGSIPVGANLIFCIEGLCVN